MSNRTLLIRVLVGLALPTALSAAVSAADVAKAPAGLTAEQIVTKYVAARGGLQTWHAVQTMSWTGKMDAGSGDSAARSANFIKQTWGKKGKKAQVQAAEQAEAASPQARQVQLPFVLEMKRPAKSRVEVEFAGKTAIQVFDGKSGWMKRPFLNREDWEPFSQEQTRSMADKWAVDGPLFDYAAKGSRVALEGVEAVQGQPAYKLKLTLKDGNVQHVWLDRKTFLDVKVEGTPRRMDGKMHAVWIYQRDFRPVGGVMVPFVLETVVDGYPDMHRMQLENVAVNPKLDDTRFVKPGA